MVMFSTISSSFVYILYGVLKVDYGIWIGFWCAAGAVAGMKLLDKVQKTINRQSPIVMILAFVLGLSALLVPIFGAIDLSD